MPDSKRRQKRQKVSGTLYCSAIMEVASESEVQTLGFTEFEQTKRPLKVHSILDISSFHQRDVRFTF